MTGLSEYLRRILRRFDIRTAFITISTLREQLTRVKNVDHSLSKAGVVYRVPCSCGKEYIGETKRAMGTHIKKHQSATRRRETEKFAITEHAWTEQHHPIWDQTSVIEQAWTSYKSRRHSALWWLKKESFRIGTRVQPSLAVGNHFYSQEHFTLHNHICHQQKPCSHEYDYCTKLSTVMNKVPYKMWMTLTVVLTLKKATA